MAAVLVGRVYILSFIVLLCSPNISCDDVNPEVKIRVFTPKGFRATIPGFPGSFKLIFNGIVINENRFNAVQRINEKVIKYSDGQWGVEDPEVKLEVGDVIDYNYFFLYMVKNQTFTKIYNGSYAVTEDRNIVTTSPTSPTRPTSLTSPTSPSSQCRPTVTKVRGGSACAGQTIFEDNFDSLNEDIWQIEQFIPVNHPEFPFVSYQRLASNPTVSVANGILRITSRLQQNQPGFNNESIFSGSLNLFSGCTGSATECTAQAWGASILPPVVSGRLTSKGLAFTYGTVHIRAKLPQGDWLYPEILLEPVLKKYGNLNYASGVLRIASALGSKGLYIQLTDFGNNVLYGGPIMDFECRQYLIRKKELSNGTTTWGDDFHVYSIKWTPDRITLLVDSEEWARIEPTTGGLVGHFPPSCSNLPRELLARGTKMAPFDDHFYLTLGMAAGGITEFKDHLYSRDGPKPWKNQARKATLNFWQAVDSWYPTWTNAELLVDYVKVVAL